MLLFWTSIHQRILKKLAAWQILLKQQLNTLEWSRTVAGDDKSESVWLWLSCKGRAGYLEGLLKQDAADIRALGICGVLQQPVTSMNTHQTLKFKTTHKNTLIHTIPQSSVLLTHQANSSHS